LETGCEEITFEREGNNWSNPQRKVKGENTQCCVRRGGCTVDFASTMNENGNPNAATTAKIKKIPHGWERGKKVGDRRRIGRGGST